MSTMMEPQFGYVLLRRIRMIMRESQNVAAAAVLLPAVLSGEVMKIAWPMKVTEQNRVPT